MVTIFDLIVTEAQKAGYSIDNGVSYSYSAFLRDADEIEDSKTLKANVVRDWSLTAPSGSRKGRVSTTALRALKEIFESEDALEDHMDDNSCSNDFYAHLSEGDVKFIKYDGNGKVYALVPAGLVFNGAPKGSLPAYGTSLEVTLVYRIK